MDARQKIYIKQNLKSKLSNRQFLAMDNICVTHEKWQRTLAILKNGSWVRNTVVHRTRNKKKSTESGHWSYLGNRLGLIIIRPYDRFH